MASQTLSELRTFFLEKTGHRPSPRMWEALTDLAVTLEQMADGSADPVFYLSSLDPGVGKSETVAHFLRVLLASPRHVDIAVMVCVSRKDEIRGYIDRAGIGMDAAVLTSDDAVNGLGGGDRSACRVLFTTQQMVESRCRDVAFNEARDFHYKGRVRQVRIWDESILPGKTLTLNRDDIAALIGPLRMVSPKFGDDLDALFTTLRAVPDGSLFDMPPLNERHGLAVEDAMRLVPTDRGAQAAALWCLLGHRVVVRKDGARGNTVLDYTETLPGDLAPLIVLDASGRVRATYRQWEEGRGSLRRLKTAAKSYANLRVNVWRRSGGKRAFAGKSASELIRGIAQTIDAKPHEPWLVIHHKAGGALAPVDEAVVAAMATEPARVHFTTWGNHHATNQYSHIANVILAGTLFYRPSHYESLGRLSAGLRPSDGPYPKRAQKEIIRGEHAHLVLQALCRGTVRLCDGNQCKPCEAYVIASVGNGIEDDLQFIFPECKVRQWDPLPREPRGKVAAAIEFIENWYANGRKEDLPFWGVKTAICMTNSANFKKRVREHPEFVNALARLGVVECGTQSRMVAFRRLTTPASVHGFLDERAGQAAV